VAELLKDVLPVGDALNQETVRTNLHATAERLEQELGEEQLCLFDHTQEDWEQQGLPDDPMTVGIDGGYVRAAHKEGWFEVIAGKSVVAFRREGRGRDTVSQVLRVRSDLRRQTAPPAVGADEIARHEIEPTGGFHVRRRRDRPKASRVPSSVQRARNRLVSRHYAIDGAESVLHLRLLRQPGSRIGEKHSTRKPALFFRLAASLVSRSAGPCVVRHT